MHGECFFAWGRLFGNITERNAQGLRPEMDQSTHQHPDSSKRTLQHPNHSDSSTAQTEANQLQHLQASPHASHTGPSKPKRDGERRRGPNGPAST